MKTRILMLLPAGILLFAACKKSNGTYKESTADRADSTSTVSESIASKPKLIKTGEMQFKVKDVQRTGEEIAGLTAQYGGMVIHHNMTSTAEHSQDIQVSDDSLLHVSAFNTIAEMTVKIPPQYLEEFMNKVNRMGVYVNLRKMDIEDKTIDYIASRLKQSNRADIVGEEKGKITPKNAASVLAVKDDLVDEKVSNLRIDDAVHFSVVSLKFFQSNGIIKEIIANDDPSAYTISFFKSAALAFENGWYAFKVVIITLINIWAFLLAAVAIWICYRIYRNRMLLKVNNI